MLRDPLRAGVQCLADTEKNEASSAVWSDAWGGYGSAKLVCVNVSIMCMNLCVAVCGGDWGGAAGFLGQVSQQWLGWNSTKSLLKWHTSPRVSHHVLLLRQNPREWLCHVETERNELFYKLPSRDCCDTNR